jgi:hypothetical protein
MSTVAMHQAAPVHAIVSLSPLNTPVVQAR